MNLVPDFSPTHRHTGGMQSNKAPYCPTTYGLDNKEPDFRSNRGRVGHCLAGDSLTRQRPSRAVKSLAKSPSRGEQASPALKTRMVEPFFKHPARGHPAVSISLPFLSLLPSRMESETATCYRCRRDLPVAAFAVDRSKGSGRKSICRECDRAKAKVYYAQRRRGSGWRGRRPGL
jgi:hypothetical protein